MKTSRGWSAVGRGILVLVVIMLLGRLAAPHWAEIREAGRAAQIGWEWAGVSTTLFALYYASIFRIWQLNLQLAGLSFSGRQAADTWVPGLLARYIPGKIWSNGLRLAVARRAGAPMVALTGAMGWEALLAVASATAFALLALSTWPSTEWRTAAMIVLVGSMALLVTSWSLVSRAVPPAWMARLGFRSSTLKWPSLLGLGAQYFVAWALFGLAFWTLTRAIAPVTAADLPTIAGAVALAWVGGYLSIVMPAGLGVREGLLIVILGPVVGIGEVAIVAGASRLISIGLDLAITGLWLWWRKTRPPGVARSSA